MTLDIFAREAFEYFCEKIYGDHQYGTTRSKKAASFFQQFVASQELKYGSSVGPSFIWMYITYQFSRFEIVDFKPTTPSGRLIPTIVFAKAAVEKFEKRNQEMDGLLLKSEFIGKYGINKAEFTKKRKVTFKDNMKVVEEKVVVMKSDFHPDTTKRNAVRLIEPLSVCIDMNDLYNHRDPSCKICKDAVECKAKLKETYPKIYQSRNYE